MATRFLNRLLDADSFVPIVFLLRDDFTTDDAAPITSPRTSEPGPGTLTFVETDGTFAIAGTNLDFTAQTTQVWGDLSYGGPSTARVAGKMLYEKINLATTTKICLPIFWGTVGSGPISNREVGIYFAAAAAIQAMPPAGSPAPVVGAYASSTTYELAVILRGTGSFLLIKGGAYAEWTLLYVENTTSTATLYPEFANWNHEGWLDDLRVAQLPAPWDTDNGIATDASLTGVRSSTEIFTHEADCVVEWENTTLPTSGNGQMRLRHDAPEAGDFWNIRHDSDGVLRLIEVDAGVPTERAATGAGTLTGGERMVTVAVDETITVYGDDVQLVTYASAAQFKTNTKGKIVFGTDWVVSDVISWPRTLSGDALTTLEARTE